MKRLRYALLADGTSDRCLLRIIDWVLQESSILSAATIDRQFADPARLPSVASGLSERLSAAVRLFPCDILFIHRDAERQLVDDRIAEIKTALARCEPHHHVCVIPVRMTEAWLLLDEAAIRTAADNPNGRASLRIPPLRQLEAVPDPKALLDDLLLTASEKCGRRLDQFRRDLAMRRGRVADLTGGFSSLRQLSAFRRFEEEANQVLQSWLESPH